MANVKSLKTFLKCSGRFLFSRSFLRLLLKRPSRGALAHVLLVPGYQAVYSVADQPLIKVAIKIVVLRIRHVLALL